MPEPTVPGTPSGENTATDSIPRRTITRTAAWSMPVALAVVSTPLAAASPTGGIILFDYPEYIVGPGMTYGSITGKVVPNVGTSLPATVKLTYPTGWSGPSTASVNPVTGTFTVTGVVAPSSVSSGTLTASSSGFTPGTTTLTVALNPVPAATDGVVWGENLDVTLYYGNVSSNEPYARTPNSLTGAGTLGAKQTIAMAGGYRGVNSYLIRSDNTLWSHGDGGTSTAPGTSAFIAGQFPFSGSTALLPGEKFVDVVGFTGGGYVLTTHGRIFSWGYNTGAGTLGNGTLGPDTKIPVLVTNPGPDVFITAISAHYSGGIALDSKGRVWSWGINDAFDCGSGRTGSQTRPVPVVLQNGSQLAGVKQIRGKFKGGLALRTDGTVYSWGDGLYGMNGNGGTANQNYAAPVLTGPGTPLTAIATLATFYHEAYHSVALGTNGTLYSWGNGSYFVHTPANQTNRLYAAPTAYSVQGPIVDVAVSYYGIHVRLSDSTVWNWGYGIYGQGGNGAITTYVRTPTQTLSGPGSPVAAGGFFPNSHGGIIARK